MTPTTHHAERVVGEVPNGCVEGGCSVLFQEAKGSVLGLTAADSGVRLRVATASPSFGAQVGEVIGTGPRLATVHSHIRLPNRA